MKYQTFLYCRHDVREEEVIINNLHSSIHIYIDVHISDFTKQQTFDIAKKKKEEKNKHIEFLS